MKSKWIALAILAVFALTLVGCGGAKQEDVIKIGHAVALTGDSSMWGIAEKNALEMEIAKINAAGGVLGKKLQLIAYDTRADATEAVNVTKRLVSQDKVAAIIGPGQSGVAIAMSSVTEPGKVPMIGTTPTNPKVTVDDKTNQVRKYSFRTCFIDPFQGTVAAQFATKELKAKTAAVVYDVGSDYSSWLGKYFIEEFTKQGGTIANNEAFRSGELDFRAILGKVKQANPDVIFIPTMQKEAALVMKQARDLGITAKFLGGDGWGSPDLITLGGSAVEGSYFVNLASLDDPDIQKWIADYKAKYNQEPVLPNPVMAVDGLLAVVDAIKKANSADPVKIAEQLEKTKDLPVLTGKLTIDPKTHNPLNKPAVMQEVKGGKFVFKSKVVTQ
ncbi:ABC transporter substrate-binding protein [Anaerosporomusa subterranea]|uniref:ABC transporter substrate-binding protein n=1 Tax=Anaerosporomusa subterranea TaxID=1794912 RepID=A0A154BQN8_ANASB|nr:ABC transporter substrate-binding protein [Anaerosporomusa subterranea]KYZ76180.1 ABC transporter substrate-binding protein [Anaerosporomusa subterranea]